MRPNEKTSAIISTMIEDFFEKNYTEDDKKPGISNYELVRLFPRIQTLAFIASDYLFEMGKAVKTLEDEAISQLKQNQT